MPRTDFFLVITVSLIVSFVLIGVHNIWFELVKSGSFTTGHQDLKKHFFLAFIWILSLFLAKKIGFFDPLITIEDNGSFLFILFLPLLVLFHFDWKAQILKGLIFFLFAAVYSLNKFEVSSQLFTVLVFFFLATGTLQKIIQLAKTDQ